MSPVPFYAEVYALIYVMQRLLNIVEFYNLKGHSNFPIVPLLYILIEKNPNKNA